MNTVEIQNHSDKYSVRVASKSPSDYQTRAETFIQPGAKASIQFDENTGLEISEVVDLQS